MFNYLLNVMMVFRWFADVVSTIKCARGGYARHRTRFDKVVNSDVDPDGSSLIWVRGSGSGTKGIRLREGRV